MNPLAFTSVMQYCQKDLFFEEICTALMIPTGRDSFTNKG